MLVHAILHARFRQRPRLWTAILVLALLSAVGGSPPAGAAPAPSRPSAVRAVSLDSAALLAWRAPSKPRAGKPRVRGYEVRVSGNGGRTWSRVPTTRKKAVRVAGLRNGTRYVFQVRAVGKERKGRWSRRSAPVIPAAPPAAVSPAPVAPPVVPSGVGRVAGVYWTGWSPSPSVAGLPSGYNLAYLFAAHRTTGGRVGWGYARPEGIETARARGMRVLLSTGGAGSGISFTSREMSTQFVDSVEAISVSWGGTRARPAFDGVDLNTFEADAVPNTAEYVWMGQEFKRRFGAGFLVTSPPAPWKAEDREFARTMLAAGAMDYVAPQFYDGPGLADPAYIVNSVRTWVRDVAGGDPSRVVVGFGISPGSANYSTTDQVRQAWDQIEAEFPRIRGAFLWSHTGDQANGWGFASTITPLILS